MSRMTCGVTSSAEPSQCAMVGAEMPRMEPTRRPTPTMPDVQLPASLRVTE